MSRAPGALLGLQSLYERFARANRQRVLTASLIDTRFGTDHLIDSGLFQEPFADDPMVVIDGGARGALFEPFDSVDPARLVVVRFEPDPGAILADVPGAVTITRGLWSERDTIDLHLAETPAASSVFPPDEALLRQFPDHIGYPPRRTREKIRIEVDSIDACVHDGAIPAPDFIKLDVHGAEYEALEGARTSLEASVVAVLVESWTLPIHRGQRTHGAVESLLNDHGFHLQKQRVNSLWPRTHPALSVPEDTIVAYESLYIRDLFAQPGPVEASSALKGISVAELFQLPVLALQLNDRSRKAGVLGAALCDDIQRYIERRYRQARIALRGRGRS